jgi:hypothetical protein
MQNGTEADYDFLEDRFVNLPMSETKVSAVLVFCDYLTKLSDPVKIKSGSIK